MPDRVITAEALITAKDGTGDVFEKIAAKFQKIGHGAAVSKDLEKMSAGLKSYQSQLAALEKFQSTRAGFTDARARFQAQKVAVEQAARALKNAEKPTRELETAYKRAQDAVSRASSAFEKQKATLIDAKRAAEGFGSPISKIAAEQSRLRETIESTTRAIEKQGAAELKGAETAARAAREAEKANRRRGGHGDISGRQMAVGIVGGAIAHETAHFARESLETYREFDKERRYAKAVMNISDEEQAPLITQAIHGGASSKFNDIQWLEGQRELAARGLRRDQVLGITPIAARLGQAMDISLPEATRLLEGGVFGFGKDISTREKSEASSSRTADLQVKAAKISGMNADDVKAAYKYAAGPARMAGLSEEQMLAIAAVGKKANMPGDEMGTAIRALSGALLKPTSGARTAMLANGINFSNFQRLGAQPMHVEPFAQDIATQYGVALNEKAKAALQRIFDNREIVKDAGKFMPAIMHVLGKELGGDDAKSKSKIAGEARRYRDAAMAGVDAQGLFDALLPVIVKNPSLANLLFGQKQGGRLGLVMGSADVLQQKLEELRNHSSGYAENISEQRMAGFDGAMSRLEGAKKNLESALPRAFDNNGKGGVLTSVTDAMGHFVQSLAEAPPALQRLGASVGVAASAFAGFKGAEALLGGFGLKEAAGMLTRAAESIIAAEGKKGAADAVEGAAGAAGVAGAGKGKRGVWRRVGGFLKWVPIIGGAVETADVVHDAFKEKPGNRAVDVPVHWLHENVPYLPKPYAHETSDLPGVDDTPRIGGRRGFMTRAHPSLAGPSPFGGSSSGGSTWLTQPPHPSLAPPAQGGTGPLGKITAVVEKPVDVTGKVELKGQASVSVSVKVDGGTVTNTASSSSGNIKVSTGASMPGAKSAAGASH